MWIHLFSRLKFQEFFFSLSDSTYWSFLTSGECSSDFLGIFWLGFSSCSKSCRAVRIRDPNLRASWRRETQWETKSVYMRFRVNFNDCTHSVGTWVLARNVKGKNVSWQHQVTNTVTVIGHLEETHSRSDIRTTARVVGTTVTCVFQEVE